MAEKYDYRDVIIDPADPRVEIGAQYYRSNYPNKVLMYANNGDAEFGILEGINNERLEMPFIIKEKRDPCSIAPWICLIRKKEPETSYIPFDLSKPEVRDSLRGKWIKSMNGNHEMAIDGFVLDSSEGEWLVRGVFTGADLLEGYVFLDGSLCGEEMPV